MGYWTIIPKAVRKSKILTGDEKDLYYEIADNLNEAGYCTLTNSQLAKNLGATEKTVSTRLSSLVQKKYANTLVNLHKHQRRIYLKVPFGDPEASNETPTDEDEETKGKRERLVQSLKKAIVLGTCDFNVLMTSLKQSPYLEEVKDNNIQAALDLEQIKFLGYFLNQFKNKSIDCQVSIFPDSIDYELLTQAIQQSEFLENNDNLSLSWCLKNYKDIVSGKYKTWANEEKTKTSKETQIERAYKRLVGNE